MKLPKRRTLLTFRSSEEAFLAIASAAAYLGWAIAAPDNGDPHAIVDGLVIGTDEYIDRVLPEEK